MLKTRGFLFDLNRCTGCEACRLACAIENEIPAGGSWRRVETFNPRGHPAAPRFHLSLACNHCADPPCRDACPALAIRRDETTGSVLLDPRKCIGCRYCTWACPYDAPRYDPREGVVAKCTLCHSRLARGDDPACAALCPTGALGFGSWNDSQPAPAVPGFPDLPLRPAIRFTPLASGPPLPGRGSAPAAAPSAQEIRLAAALPARRIRLRDEWPLLAFTLLVPGLVAWWTAAQLSSFALPPLPFLAAAATAILVSTAHLGRKTRAWRAVINLRRSWLSREIFFYGLFVLVCCAALFVSPPAPALNWLAVAAGFGALYSMDRLYDVAVRPGPSRLHSADVILTGVLLTGLLAGEAPLAAASALLKLGLYLRRKLHSRSLERWSGLLFGTLRLGPGLFFPALLWATAWPGWQGWALAGVALGEVIDRVEFYSRLDVLTPGRQLAVDLRSLLAADETAS